MWLFADHRIGAIRPTEGKKRKRGRLRRSRKAIGDLFLALLYRRIRLELRPCRQGQPTQKLRSDNCVKGGERATRERIPNSFDPTALQASWHGGDQRDVHVRPSAVSCTLRSVLAWLKSRLSMCSLRERDDRPQTV
jgi:hypothetical protein